MANDVVKEGSWSNPGALRARRYTCGFCGATVAADKGYFHQHQTAGNDYVGIRICPNCNRPTFFVGDDYQYPGGPFGRSVQHLPQDVHGLYEEARSCMTVGAFTAAVMAARKILMNVAVNLGDKPGKTFAEYVDYLDANHYVPAGGKKWVDHIRNKGNDANHEIPQMTKQDAEMLLTFLEMLLTVTYEFPAMAPP